MDTTTATVIPFRSRASIALGRRRRPASLLIAERLRALAELASFAPCPQAGGTSARLVWDRLSISFVRNADGLYFRIDGGSDLLMSGYIDPPERAKYANGRLHVMSWRRGWEAALV